MHIQHSEMTDSHSCACPRPVCPPCTLQWCHGTCPRPSPPPATSGETFGGPGAARGPCKGSSQLGEVAAPHSQLLGRPGAAQCRCEYCSSTLRAQSHSDHIVRCVQEQPATEVMSSGSGGAHGQCGGSKLHVALISTTSRQQHAEEGLCDPRCTSHVCTGSCREGKARLQCVHGKVLGGHVGAECSSSLPDAKRQHSSGTDSQRMATERQRHG